MKTLALSLLLANSFSANALAGGVDEFLGEYEILALPFEQGPDDSCRLKDARIERGEFGGYKGIVFHSERKQDNCSFVYRFGISTDAPGIICSETSSQVICDSHEGRNVVSFEKIEGDITQVTLQVEGPNADAGTRTWKLKKR